VRNGRGSGGYSNGEYAAIAVYDELLDEFDKDDLSSCGDSSVEIVSDCSDDKETVQFKRMDNSRGAKKRQGIEMIPFDDGRLNMREING
jgi:hypothetical protein